MRFNDLTGKKFGRLAVLYQVNNNKNNKVIWHCRCDCGSEKDIIGSLLVTGRTQSCGCLKTEKTIERSTKHGMSKTRIYNIHQNIISRCENKNNPDFIYYGGRGITICNEWRKNFTMFYNWAMENGYKENLTIDRINTNGNYEPNNCRWATRVIQAQNRRIKSTNTSGITGVEYKKENGKWVAVISANKNNIWLGEYNTFAEAALARKQAELKYWVQAI
jgi:hypothetical protein